MTIIRTKSNYEQDYNDTISVYIEAIFEFEIVQANLIQFEMDKQMLKLSSLVYHNLN